MTDKNIARIDLAILARQLQEHHPGLCIFHSGTASGYYLVKNRERITVDMPLEQLFAYCISLFADHCLTKDTSDLDPITDQTHA